MKSINLSCLLFFVLSLVLAAGVNGADDCAKDFIKISDQCYYFSTETVQVWDDAIKQCQSLNPQAILYTPDTKEKWDPIQDYISKDSEMAEKYWWLGGSDTAEEGKWTWAKTNEPFNFNEWCQQQPNNLDDNENCIHIAPKNWKNTGRLCWNDLTCADNKYGLKLNFICEIPL